MEEVAEEVEVRFYPQEGFTEMNKDGNMDNRIGVEVMELDTIIEEKTTKEIRCEEGQSALNKILKQSNLLSPFIWSLITSGRAPLDYVLGLQEAFIYHHLEAPFLPTILDVMSDSLTYARGLRMQVAETRFGKAGARSDYFPHKERAGTNLDLILGAAADAGQRKMKCYCSESASERVSKP
jgi:hypothetical protein